MVALKLGAIAPETIGTVPGSRNAVVALKRTRVERGIKNAPSKQERRGGIETKIRWLNPVSAPLKQERRGGIETRVTPEGHHLAYCEAGTPWWH